MALTESRILECKTDDELYELLSAELCERLPDEEGETYEDLDVFVTALRALPVGLRAMAATYQLDVSLTLDDFGWHFANWHHREYCDETLRGLRELEANEMADLFEAAYAYAQRHWDTIDELLDVDFDEFVQWYVGSEFEKSTMPLTKRAWELCGLSAGPNTGLLTLWAPYARKYPHRVVMLAA